MIANKLDEVMMSLPRITHPYAAILLCLTVVTLQGQPGDGFSVQERAGVVLVKPQPWSKDAEATVLEFQAYINRRADGTSGAGYYEFRTKNADRRQVPIGRIVKLVVYPDVQQLKEIVSPQDRQALVSNIEEIKAVVAKFPASRTYLDPSIKKLNEELAQYDSGKVKTEGVWVSKQTFVMSKAIKLASLLKADIDRARPPSSLDLEHDPKFTGLKELGETNSDAKKLATEISAQFEKLVRAEKRSDLLARLSKSGTSLAEAEATLNELKTLQPEEDPKSAACVKIWDSGLATVRAASGEAEKISKSLERELANFSADDAPPQISPELEKQISAISAIIARFLSTNPPSPVGRRCRSSRGRLHCRSRFQEAKSDFRGEALHRSQGHFGRARPLCRPIRTGNDARRLRTSAPGRWENRAIHTLARRSKAAGRFRQEARGACEV